MKIRPLQGTVLLQFREVDFEAHFGPTLSELVVKAENGVNRKVTFYYNPNAKLLVLFAHL